MAAFLCVILAAVFGGFVQTVTGFGSAIVMMLFIPSFFPMVRASALCASISVFLNIGLCFKNRKTIRWDLIVLPIGFYWAASSFSILFAKQLPIPILKKLFGGFLLLLAVYFLAVRGKIKLKGSKGTAIGCALISGLAHGAFGAGGPPMAVYFLSVLEDRHWYLGTLQTFYLLTGIYSFIFRTVNGIYTADLIGFSLIGIVGVFVGLMIGSRISDHLPVKQMKTLVYLMLAFSGILYLVR